jgi:lipopolysaccharide/colanic/teichoic acid biosynthesis glycosyltransferase
MFSATFDRLLAGIGLVLAAPVLLAGGLLIVLEDGFPVFFRQTRVGVGGTPFRLWKLRSMRKNVSGTHITASGDRRLLRSGRLLRKFKIDELPQLWNVLRGDMTLVGPRPEVPEFVTAADPQWRIVLSVRPGITDATTLIYRNEEELLARRDDPETFYRGRILPAKLALNIDYLARRSFWLDLKLILLTIRFSFVPAGFSPDQVARAFRLRYKAPE